MYPKEFFLIPEDVFRVGNTTSPRLSHLRSGEVVTNNINGIIMIVANRRGVSLYALEELKAVGLTGWVWRFEGGTKIPIELMVVNDHSGHFMLVPKRTMPLDKYKGLLEEVALNGIKAFKL